MVLTIEGSADKFGFIESSSSFNALSTMRKVGRNAKIYYDSKGQRIENGITLHVFDLTIGNYKAIDIKKKRREGWPTAWIFFAGTLVFLIMIIGILRDIIQKSRKRKIQNSTASYN